MNLSKHRIERTGIPVKAEASIAAVDSGAAAQLFNSIETRAAR
jgi:hypothetical protein